METTMGLMYSFTWNNDPKHVGLQFQDVICFKMLEEKNVLEVGCWADGLPEL